MSIGRLLTIIRLRVRSLLRAGAVDRELDEELRDHIERQTDANIALGLPPGTARTLALRAMGGVERRKEECRDARGVTWVENLAGDVRLAARQLVKQPAFTLAAVLSLALGIGANTAMFQLLSALSLRMLPVRAPAELVEVRLTGDGRGGRHTGRNEQMSLPHYQAIAGAQQAFSSVLAFGDTRFNLSPQGEVRYVEGLWVSGSFFETLGVEPLLGRLIAPADDVPGCGFPGAVISYSHWQRDFGGRADITGQTIPFGGRRVPILGVTPPEFFGVEVGRQFAVAMPLCSAGFDRRDHFWLAAVGRLAPGWTRAQAQAQLRSVLPTILRDTAPDYRPDDLDAYLNTGLEVAAASTGLSPMRGTYERPLWVLQAIAALVLLIASANLANLMLARSASRAPEFAVRLALGGPRRRLVQQVLIECGLLAVIGTGAAIAVAAVVSRSIPALLSTATDTIHLSLAVDWRLFAFAVFVAGASTAIFATAPALQAGRATVLRPAPRGAGHDRAVLRRALVTLQLAVTLVLLFTGLLFARSFRNLSIEEIGVNPSGLVVANVFFRESDYPPETRVTAYAAIAERLESLPGVTEVAEAYTTPLGGSFWNNGIAIDGVARGSAHLNQVSAGYFAALGTPLLAGRGFGAGDTPASSPVAMVSHSFAEHFFDGDAIGRRFGLLNSDSAPPRQVEVIGVVADQKYGDLREEAPRIVYLASSQAEPGLTQRFIVRSAIPPAATIAALSAALQEADPAGSVRYALLDTQVAEAMLQEQLLARLSAAFGLVALVLAVVGVYGVVSYMVTSRRGELGVRVALGATRVRILAMVLGDVGWMLIAGIGTGTVLALVAARGIGSLLFGLAPTDPATLMLAAGVLVVTAFASAAWPARRASTADPLATLREG